MLLLIMVSDLFFSELFFLLRQYRTRSWTIAPKLNCNNFQILLLQNWVEQLFPYLMDDKSRLGGEILTGDVAVAEFILELSGASGASGGGGGEKTKACCFFPGKQKREKTRSQKFPALVF